MSEEARKNFHGFLSDQIGYWEDYLARNPSSGMIPEIKDGLRRLRDML